MFIDILTVDIRGITPAERISRAIELTAREIHDIGSSALVASVMFPQFVDVVRRTGWAGLEIKK